MFAAFWTETRKVTVQIHTSVWSHCVCSRPTKEVSHSFLVDSARQSSPVGREVGGLIGLCYVSNSHSIAEPLVWLGLSSALVCEERRNCEQRCSSWPGYLCHFVWIRSISDQAHPHEEFATTTTGQWLELDCGSSLGLLYMKWVDVLFLLKS